MFDKAEVDYLKAIRQILMKGLFALEIYKKNLNDAEKQKNT